MSGEIELWCWVQEDEFDEDHVFQVRIKLTDTVFILMQAIRATGPSLLRIGPEDMQLWKFELAATSMKNAPEGIKLEDGERLKSMMEISDIWKEQPSKDTLSVILKTHSVATITSSLSVDSNVAPWLPEIHKKLWGRRDLVGQIFRKANLTKTDFVELQDQLQSVNPSRSSTSYIAVDVLATKAGFLRSRSFIDEEAVAYFATCGAAPDSNLVPQPIVDSGATSPNLTMVDIETLDVDAIGNDTMDDAMDIDAVPAAYLSEGRTAVFPCTIRYIDLTILKLEYLSRVPHMIFIRDEWRTMIDFFNKRKKGIRGSAAFTGQPGIGKTCMLYYILILCIIRAQPVLFQDISGEVLFIDKEVRDEFTTRRIPGQDVLALVDADHHVCVPRTRLFKNNIRVLLMSSPRTRSDRKWLTQYVQDGDAVFLVKPWSREELFISPIDITLKRLNDVMRICGCNPRECHAASASPDALQIATQKIIDAIMGTEDMSGAIRNVATGQPIHLALEVWPSPDIRAWECFEVRPISDWAFSQMVAELDRRDADAAYDFYRSIHGTHNSAILCGQLFKIKIHKFFQSITEPRSFTIRSLDNSSRTFDIEFSSSIVHHAFGAEQAFADHLMTSVRNQESCYLKSLSPIFPTFDSFLYQHKMSQSGCQPLIGLQVTTNAAHPISTMGLANIQACLKRQVPELSDLRPTMDTKWIILFVVPDSTAASFVKQIIKDATHWGPKTTQYVLGLPVREVLRSNKL